MMFFFRIIMIIITIAISNIANAQKNNILNITTSIIPLQSLVSMVTSGTNDSVDVILSKSNVSPHDSTLNYREMSLIKKSNIIFLISKNFEHDIDINIDKSKTKVIYLDEKINSKLADFNELSYKKIDNNAHSHNHKHEHEHNHNNEVKDYHIWLDTNKAQEILVVIASELSKINPNNKEIYNKNIKDYSLQLQNLQKEMKQTMDSIKDNFMVYHNAWGYFIQQNNLSKLYKGSIVSNEADHSHIDTNLSAKNVIELTNYIKEHNVSCILLEPQFEDKTVQNIIKKNNIKTAILNPIGDLTSDLANNYIIMMKKNTQQLKSCV